jgi:quercetin dioxygenase-like cupin family protein
MKTSKVFSLSKMIDYQKDSIVSRLLIDKNSGSVTLFAFDKGQALSEHTAPFDAIVNIIEGKAEISISGKKFSLGKGDIIVMPANKPHAVKALEKFKMILIMIRDKNE